MWLSFALLSGVFFTGSVLVTRHILKEESSDAWAFSFFYSAVGALVSLPFMASDIKVAVTIGPWLLMLIVGFLIVIQNLLYISSSKYVVPSVIGSITKFRLIWVMILGVIILHESSSVLKVIGTVLTVASGIVVVRNLSRPKDARGILYAFLATIFYAFVIVLYKYLFSSFNPQSLTFFIFFIPTILNIVIMPNFFQRTWTLATHRPAMVLVGCSLGAFANLAMNQGLSLGEASRVLVVIESFLVITLVAEHVVLKEKGNLIAKAVAVVCATAGAVLMRVG